MSAPGPHGAAGPSPLSTVADTALPALPPGGPAIGLEHVWLKAASGLSRLRDVNLTIERGEHWGVLGANGSGKSTLLTVMRGRLQPSAGSVLVLGQQHGATGFSDPGPESPARGLN